MLHVCTSGFMNDDMCPHSGSYGDMSIPLQLRAQDNASAASCWLRHAGAPKLDEFFYANRSTGGGDVCDALLPSLTLFPDLF